jgi:hypothetical protein
MPSYPYYDDLFREYREGYYDRLWAISTVTTLGATSGVAFLFVQLASATLPVGLLLLIASLLSVVAYIFVTPKEPSYRQRESEPPRPQRTRTVFSGGLSRLVGEPIGLVTFLRLAFHVFFSAIILAVFFYIMSSGMNENDKDIAVTALGPFVGLGVGYIGLIVLLLPLAVCFYAVFGPGLGGVAGKEILYALLAASVNEFFPWLQKYDKSASLVFALITVPVCFIVVFVSELEGFYEAFAGFVLAANTIILAHYFRSFMR